MATSAETTPKDSPVKEVKEGESWQFSKSVIECNRHMLDSGLAADVTFLVSSSNGGKGEVCRLQAHKYMLISRSPVFYSMLFGDLAETGEVTVTDVEPDAFKQMLSYIYTDELDLKPDLVMFILHVSKKYLLPGLTSKCTDYLKNHLDTNNACIILDQSIIFDEKELQDRCMEIFKYKTKAAFESESFAGVRQSTLSRILDSEVFIISEVDVFEACVKWARIKCEEKEIDATGPNMREMLGDCVNKFRLTNIEIGDFARIVGHSNILTDKEELDLLRYIAHRETFPMPSGFIDENRYLAPPFKVITEEAIVPKTLGSKTFTVAIDCDTDVKIKSLMIGKCSGKSYTIDMSSRHVTIKLQNVIYNDQTFTGAVTSSSNETKQEWRNDDIIVMKAGHSTLQMSFATSHSGYNAVANVHVVPMQELLLKDKHIEMKLSTNEQFIPLLGLVYEIA